MLLSVTPSLARPHLVSDLSEFLVSEDHVGLLLAQFYVALRVVVV